MTLHVLYHTYHTAHTVPLTTDLENIHVRAVALLRALCPRPLVVHTIRSSQVGKGIAIVKLYPLDPATDAERSITLRTGFAPPSIATVEAHVSARNHGPDVRLIIGKEELMEAIGPKKAAATAVGKVENRDKETAGDDGATREGEASTSRSIVLELEIFACGAVNVRRLMEIIKGCFEQVQQSAALFVTGLWYNIECCQLSGY